MPAMVEHKGVANSIRFLSQRWHQSIRVANLAKAAIMSRRGFQKAFAKHTGSTPGRELRRFRLQRAAKLLANSNLKAHVIAKMCGYRKLNSFHVAFKQTTGLSPMQYRRRRARKAVPSSL